MRMIKQEILINTVCMVVYPSHASFYLKGLIRAFKALCHFGDDS